MARKTLPARTIGPVPTRWLVVAAGLVVGTAMTAIAGAPPIADTFIHQEVDFKASPARVYETLLDETEFSMFSGAPAQIQRNAGGPSPSSAGG
jgi:hypothetical protein